MYDITDPDRLRRVARLMKNVGSRVQLSVFELYLIIPQLRRLHIKASKVMDPKEDSVRYYLMCVADYHKRIHLGKLKFEAQKLEQQEGDFYVV